MARKRRKGITGKLKKIFTGKKTEREILTNFIAKNFEEIRNEQIQMILGILHLQRLTAENIKIPANNLVAVSDTSTVAEIEAIIRKTGHSRIPVFHEKDNEREYRGILFAKDFLSAFVKKARKFNISDFIRKPIFVPETQTLLSLLREMRLNKSHIALTVNEYGHVTGMITLEDILEEIVGDIQDEFDSEQKAVKLVAHRVYRVEGAISLDELNDELALNLPEEKFNTLAGFLLHELKGELNETSQVKYGNVIFKPEKFSNRQIRSVLVDLSAGSRKQPPG